MKKLNKNIIAGQGWHVDYNGDDGYEIKKGRFQYKVSLNTRSCACRRWDLCGIPYAHAICAILDKGDEPESYVHSCYSKDLYEKTYSYTLPPINGELLWPRTQHEEMHPPIPKKMTGRPKKKRVREETEGHPPSMTQLTRKGRIMKCSNCQGEGHNRKSCKISSDSGTEPNEGHTMPSESGIGQRGRPKRGGRGGLKRKRGETHTQERGSLETGTVQEGSVQSGSAQRVGVEKGKGQRGRGKRGGGNRGKGERGFGVFFYESTGMAILEPGQRGETLLSGGGGEEAA
ncbi:unnamed protein product [Cuscuta epithymum]|nr:unnamed protein product [Cuscuta epithymum]